MAKFTGVHHSLIDGCNNMDVRIIFSNICPSLIEETVTKMTELLINSICLKSIHTTFW